MKNSGETGNTRKKGTGTGYYIALLLCVCAVGISSYVVLSNAIRKPVAEPTKSSSAAVESPAEAVASLEENREEAEIRKKAESIRVAPVKGEILKGFSTDTLSYNGATQDWRLHDAVDIAAQGQTVKACMAGRVTEVRNDDYLGTTVTIAHSGGYTSRYANLTAMPTVKPGDRVEAGAVIGSVGTTALLESAEEPHLHFQVMQNGVSIDPMAFLDGK